MRHANDSQKMEELWRHILKALTCLLLAFTSTVAAATDYYISPSGRDTNVGTSPGSAWQTITPVNGLNLNPGDRVLFQGGATFAGNLLLDEFDSGTPASPVLITSFDLGRATIDAGDGNGIYASDCEGIEIRNLNMVGSYSENPEENTNNGSGVYFYTNRSTGTNKLEHIRIDQVDASGFRRAGIAIKSDNASLLGYRNVEITRCKAFGNGRTGIQVGGYYNNTTPALSHEDVLIAHCEVFDNKGDKTVKNNHTGSGIILSATNGAVIEFCHAHDNGEYNSSTNNGPVGIWAWQANDVIIQFNISNDNKSGSNKDGGGFDFDGGTTNSIMQYNYSYQNQGPGYLLAHFGGLYGAPPYHDNVFRYNISYNDGRGNNGGFLLWAGASISNIDIYGNTIYLTPPATGIPTPVRVFNGNYSNISVRNNIFMTGPGLPLIRSNPDLSGPDPEIHFQGNAYWNTAGDGGFKIEMNKQGDIYDSYDSLDDWQATGQEMVGNMPVGLHYDPMLVNPSSPELLTDPTQLAMLSAFKLQPESPVIDEGLDLFDPPDPGPHDFYGVPLPQGADLDIGAAEYSGSGPINQPPTAVAEADPITGTRPLTVSFTGSNSFDNDGNIVGYSWNFGDGNTSNQANPSHTYQSPDTYSAVLTVTDDDNATATDSVTITVTEPAIQPPTVTINQPADNTVFLVGTALNYSGEGIDPEDGVLPASAFTWEAAFEGGPFQSIATGVKFGSGIVPVTGNFVIRLTVEDSDGATAMDEISISGSTELPVNESPTAFAEANPTEGTAQLIVDFTGSNSSDNDGNIVGYSWNFGDGNTSNQANPSHTYQSPDTYSAVLTVTDDDNATDTDSVTITVTEPTNQSPTAVVEANPTEGTAQLIVDFTGSNSSDNDGNIVGYSWNFGDDNTSNQANPSHTYQSPDTYSAVLTVTDDDNATDTDSVTITVTEPAIQPPTVTINQPADNTVFLVGTALNYSGEGIDPEDGVLPASAFTWEAAFEGGPFQSIATGVKFGSGIVPVTGNFVIRLTVEDSDGATAMDEVRITAIP